MSLFFFFETTVYIFKCDKEQKDKIVFACTVFVLFVQLRCGALLPIRASYEKARNCCMRGENLKC